MQKEILDFIGLFSKDSESTVFKFTNGLCYWFAFILKDRFRTYSATIMYEPIDNHFVTRIGDDLYDITGVVTDQYPNVVEWNHFPYPDVKSRIVRDCILKKNGM